MLRTHRKAATKVSGKKNDSNDGVFEPDHRIVIAVMAVGMLVGALMTTSPSNKEAAKLQSPMSQQTTHAATTRTANGRLLRVLARLRRALAAWGSLTPRQLPYV